MRGGMCNRLECYLLVDELQAERIVELLLPVVIVDHSRLPVVPKVAELKRQRVQEKCE